MATAVAGQAVGAQAPAAPSRLTRSRRRAAWLFVLPMLVVLAAVAAWPLARTVWFAFTDARLDDMGAAQFIGLENFTYLLTDPAWWGAVWNTLWFTLVSLLLETVLGLAIALTLNAHFTGRGLLRAAVLIPWAIPTVVSAKMWSWMLNDVFGVVNQLLISAGLIERGIAWTASPDTAMWAIVMVDVWKTTPFMALLLLAGLQLLPGECYEAAQIDGIHPVKVFFRVTLPLLKPALLVAVIFRALDSLRIFDLIYVMTGTTDATMSMSVYARQQLFDFQEIGFGSAAATMLFAIIALITVVYLTLAGVAREDAR